MDRIHMVDLHTSPYRIFSRFFIVLRTEGPRGLFKRINSYHAFVVAFHCDQNIATMFLKGLAPESVQAMERAQRFLNRFEFIQLTASDTVEIDELTEIDPWKVPKSVSLERFQEGWSCFVAKYKGRIVANIWEKTGPEFIEPMLERSIALAVDEAYGWRGFCVPEFRGRGVLPWLTRSIINHLVRTKGLKSFMCLVSIHNKTMLRTQVQTGWSVVGRIGYFDFFGLFRLHYLWGRNAFSSTRKRIFIERLKKTS